MDFTILLNAVIAMLVITSPIDPVKIVFFTKAAEAQGLSKSTAAIRVATYVAVILFGAALIGGPLLDALGIDLNAFSVVGGLIIALMGFEMLYGGSPSKAQGRKQRDDGPDDDDALMIPLALPLIAGPGAITTVITLAAQEDGLVSALIATGVVVVTVYLAFALLGDVVSKAKPATVAILIRIGGMLLATIGAQMLLGGLKAFFAS